MKQTHDGHTARTNFKSLLCSATEILEFFSALCLQMKIKHCICAPVHCYFYSTITYPLDTIISNDVLISKNTTLFYGSMPLFTHAVVVC